jgi:ADP-ribosylglycohydrolase
MPKRTSRKAVDRLRHRDYKNAAQHFYEAAEIAMNYSYWTAAGVLIVHSAIAYADAISIKLSGQKSSGENHEDSIVLLDEVVADGDTKKNAINQLRRIIEEKTKVSYSGDLYRAILISELWKRLERFRKWAISILER